MRGRSLRSMIRPGLRGFVGVLAAVIMFIPVLALALFARGITRRRIGFGPEPLINNVHHAKALRRQGYEVTTFVSHVYYITQQFDLRREGGWPWNYYALYAFVVWRCKVLYIYFNGGPLGWTPLRALEPYLLRLAGVRVVVLAYGGDVQDFGVHNDVVYKNAYMRDYPDFVRSQMAGRSAQVARWTRGADWVVSGCDWVHYMPYWDSLMLAHFSVDMEQWAPPSPEEYVLPARFCAERPLRVVHAPNHRAIKGTEHVKWTVDELKAQGCPIELILIEKMPNDELRKVLRQADVIVEQLVIGWHGIFALEAMCLRKPVLTYIAPELERLYILAGLLRADELPFLKVDHLSLGAELRACASGERALEEIGIRSRDYVDGHHSLDVIGAEFARINTVLGVPPPASGKLT